MTKNALALVGGTVYLSPTDEPIRDGVILINSRKIEAVGPRLQTTVPPGAEILDCSGSTVTAGFWNCHVHFTERKWTNAADIPAEELSRQLEDMLTRYGFTSVFDLASMWANTRRLRERIESGEVPGPRIRSVGEGIVPKGGLPPDIVPRMMGWMIVPLPEVTNAEEAAAAARKLLAAGVDGVKTFASAQQGVTLPQSAIQAIANQAHRSGKQLFVHPNTGTDVLASLRAGADIIAHTTPHSGPWDDTIIEAIMARKVALTPTLTIWKHYARHDRVSAQDEIVETEFGQLRAWLAAGGAVLFGNDLAAVEYDPTDEYVLMSEAGMSFRQILESLTTAPAERFGESAKLGRIAAGLQADLVVLKDDPAKNIRALSSVRYTLRDGQVI